MFLCVKRLGVGVVSYLAGLVEELMLELFDAQDVLEHLVQLVLAEDQLGRGAGRHALLSLAGILVAAVDGVELGHPGAEHRLLAQAVDLRQAPHALLDVPLENFPEIAGGEAAALHHFGHAVALQEHLRGQASRRSNRNSDPLAAAAPSHRNSELAPRQGPYAPLSQGKRQGKGPAVLNHYTDIQH